MKKIIGIFIIALCLLTSAITVLLGQISMYLDQIDKTFIEGIHIPWIVYLLIIISLCIGIYLLFTKRDFKE